MSTDATPPAPPEPRPGTLYLVPTPLGDVEDLSPRARRVLAGADVIAAEDTRETRALLSKLGITPRLLLSYHDHNERQRAAELVRRLQGGASVAQVSDAGAPLVDDPGYAVVCAAIAAGAPVVALPGPSASLTALLASGIPPQAFCHLGFLPRAEGKRRGAIEPYRHHPGPLLIYEAPHRVRETLATLRDALGDRRACIGWNLTKPTESYLRGTLSSLLAELEGWEYMHGEFSLVIAPGDAGDGAARLEKAVAAAAKLAGFGVPTKALAEALAEALDLPRRDVYQALLANGVA